MEAVAGSEVIGLTYLGRAQLANGNLAGSS